MPPVVAAIVVIVALMFGPHLYSHYWLPYQLRAGLRRLVDPSAGPPASAGPVEDGFPQRLMEAVAERDSRSLADWLADDFVMIDSPGPPPQRAALPRDAACACWSPSPTSTSASRRCTPTSTQPDVLWMLSTQYGHARRGAAFEATVWSRLTLTRDRNHIREIAFEGVVRAD